jgi:hypothetical protein
VTRSRRRLVAASALVVVVLGGLIVHTRLPDSAATDIAGDALYAAATYAGVVVLLARLRPDAVAGIAAVWCVGVELFQLTGLPLRWAESFPPAVLLLGTVFDARDLLVYVLAIAVAGGADAVLQRGAAGPE